MSHQHYSLYSLSFSVSLPPFCLSLVVEDPLTVSDCTSLPAGLISDQRPVSISYVCWYRMQSLSFYDILQSDEVTKAEIGQFKRSAYCCVLFYPNAHNSYQIFKIGMD